MNFRHLAVSLFSAISLGAANGATLEEEFRNPPDSARPGVYWYFMDGNLNREEMTADLESMKEAGLGNLVFLEVYVGVPRGPVKFMSEPWQELFAHAVAEAERLGIDITLGAGPGWTGSGGPWVKAEQSMQHLVFSVVETKGPENFTALLRDKCAVATGFCLRHRGLNIVELFVVRHPRGLPGEKAHGFKVCFHYVELFFYTAYIIRI